MVRKEDCYEDHDEDHGDEDHGIEQPVKHLRNIADVRMQKRALRREDGRYLIYYEFIDKAGRNLGAEDPKVSVQEDV